MSVYKEMDIIDMDSGAGVNTDEIREAKDLRSALVHGVCMT
jgi:hypothetical protein